MKLALYAAILALNLSSAAQEAPNDGLERITYSPRHDFRPLNLGDCFSPGTCNLRRVVAESHPWLRAKPIPYFAIWNNPLGQTAQQFVAILSTLEEEGLDTSSFKEDWPD